MTENAKLNRGRIRYNNDSTRPGYLYDPFTKDLIGKTVRIIYVDDREEQGIIRQIERFSIIIQKTPDPHKVWNINKSTISFIEILPENRNGNQEMNA